MNDFIDNPYLPDDDAVNAFRDKLAKQMTEVANKMEALSKQPLKEIKTWATIGDLQYGRRITPLLIQYRALMWRFMHPPDPRGEPMCSRPGPYTVYVRREEMADVLSFHIRTVDRMLALVRKHSNIKKYGRITVELFCYLHQLPEDKIQQQLHQQVVKKFSKYK